MLALINESLLLTLDAQAALYNGMNPDDRVSNALFEGTVETSQMAYRDPCKLCFEAVENAPTVHAGVSMPTIERDFRYEAASEIRMAGAIERKN